MACNNTPYSHRLVEGYDRLGQFMGELPENAIFRRFGALAAEDLLYRQAELIELEKTLREYQAEDKESGHEDRERYNLDWDLLQNSVSFRAREGNDGGQWETILEIREKLQQYHEALLRCRRILELGKPLEKRVQILNQWMQDPTRGSVFLFGSDSKTWSEPNLEDMIALEAPSSEEGFTSALTLQLVHWYHSILGRHIHTVGEKDYLRNTIRYRDEGTFRVLKILTTTIACLLPIAGIVGLNCVQDITTKLVLTAVFTAVFSFAINVTTAASMKDVFMATAAFAAVLVVFIGTNNSGSITTT